MIKRLINRVFLLRKIRKIVGSPNNQCLLDYIINIKRDSIFYREICDLRMAQVDRLLKEDREIY